MTEATPHRYTAELANTIEQKWQAHWREHGTFNAPNPVGDLATGEELPKAFVVRAPGSELTEDAVKAYMAEKVAPHKKIRFVEFIEQVPKSAAGKILRKELKAR